MSSDQSIDNIVNGIVAYLKQVKALDLLPQIAENLKKLSWVKYDPDLATVYSAQPLSSTQIRELTASLSKYFKRQIRVKSKLDQSIIAGLKIHLAGQEIDATINRRLEDLKQQIIYDWYCFAN